MTVIYYMKGVLEVEASWSESKARGSSAQQTEEAAPMASAKKKRQLSVRTEELKNLPRKPGHPRQSGGGIHQ